MMDQKDFFAEATESQRYKITEVIGKGSYGIVASAVDQFTGSLAIRHSSACLGCWLISMTQKLEFDAVCAGEKVAIKKITNVFDHVSDATRILREIKLLRLLRHPGTLTFVKRMDMVLIDILVD